MTPRLFAHGKVILLGEHAVLAGAPALALPLGAGLRATLRRTTTGVVRLNPPVDDGRLSAALELLARLLPNPGFLLEWESALPFGAGLGASAAFSLLLARAAWEAAHPGTPTDHERIFEVTHRLEHCFHGTPSGIDDAVVCQGTPVLLQRPFVTVSWPFPKVPLAPHLFRVELPLPMELVVAHSGERADTRDMIARVRTRAGDGFVDDSRALFGTLVDALERRSPADVGAVLTRAHGLLGSVGASTTRLDRMVALALDAGALGAKLTGSGGGGCALALCARDRRELVLERWRSAGFEVVSPSGDSGPGMLD